jgi:protein TonB
MSRNNDINSPEWCNVVFEGRNKDYGAYVLRQFSVSRHVKALIIVVIIFVAAMFIPKLIDTVITVKGDEKMTEVTNISDIKVEQPKPEQAITIEIPMPIIKSSIKFTPPVIKPDDQVADDEVIKTQDNLNESKVTISIKTIEGADDTSGIDIRDLDNNVAITGENKEKDSTFVFVDQMPEYPGGEGALRKWLSSNTKYPYEAAENEIEGKVYVQFVIDKEGYVSNVKISKSVHPSLEPEALRVVKSLPRWNPGKQGGNPVKVTYTLPINFTLKR